MKVKNKTRTESPWCSFPFKGKVGMGMGHRAKIQTGILYGIPRSRARYSRIHRFSHLFLPLPKLGMLGLAGIYQLGVYLWQRFLGLRGLGGAFHDRVYAIYPQAIAFICLVLHKPRPLTGFLYFLARPFVFLFS